VTRRLDRATGRGSGLRSCVSGGSRRDAAVLDGRDVGRVNANRRHFYKAAEALSAAEPGWLERLISRRVAPQDIDTALERGPDDIKVVVDLSA
jgi:hypothetical protein